MDDDLHREFCLSFASLQSLTAIGRWGQRSGASEIGVNQDNLFHNKPVMNFICSLTDFAARDANESFDQSTVHVYKCSMGAVCFWKCMHAHMHTHSQTYKHKLSLSCMWCLRNICSKPHLVESPIESTWQGMSDLDGANEGQNSLLYPAVKQCCWLRRKPSLIFDVRCLGFFFVRILQRLPLISPAAAAAAATTTTTALAYTPE